MKSKTSHRRIVWVAGYGTCFGVATTPEGATELLDNGRKRSEINVRSFPLTGQIEELELQDTEPRPIYGGATLLEALWEEMDRLMEGLMTKQAAEDGGDRYRAEQLCWALALVTNGYDPDMDAIRAEAMRRWKEAEAEADAQEEALNPDQDEIMTRPEGADQ